MFLDINLIFNTTKLGYEVEVGAKTNEINNYEKGYGEIDILKFRYKWDPLRLNETERWSCYDLHYDLDIARSKNNNPSLANPLFKTDPETDLQTFNKWSEPLQLDMIQDCVINHEISQVILWPEPDDNTKEPPEPVDPKLAEFKIGFSRKLKTRGGFEDVQMKIGDKVDIGYSYGAFKGNNQPAGTAGQLLKSATNVEQKDEKPQLDLDKNPAMKIVTIEIKGKAATLLVGAASAAALLATIY